MVTVPQATSEWKFHWKTEKALSSSRSYNALIGYNPDTHTTEQKAKDRTKKPLHTHTVPGRTFLHPNKVLLPTWDFFELTQELSLIYITSGI